MDPVHILMDSVHGHGSQRGSMFCTLLFVLTDSLLANGNELKLILLKFARPLYFFFLISSLVLTKINIFR